MIFNDVRRGQIVRNQEIGLLSEEDRRHLCELDWDTSAVLLPPGCYFNHACDPNAMRKGTHVFAWQPIRAEYRRRQDRTSR
jgi:hypothetical protein